VFKLLPLSLSLRSAQVGVIAGSFAYWLAVGNGFLARSWFLWSLCDCLDFSARRNSLRSQALAVNELIALPEEGQVVSLNFLMLLSKHLFESCCNSPLVHTLDPDTPSVLKV